MSPKAWKSSFSEFHWNYNPKSSLRSSFRSPEKPLHSTLPRVSSSIAGSSHQSILETSESRDQGTELNHSEMSSPSADGQRAQEAAGDDSKEEEKHVKEEESEPPAECDEKAPPSESSSEENLSFDSESLELQLSAAGDNGLLHIDESDESPEDLNSPKENGLENVSGVKALSSPPKVCVLSSTRLRADDANLLCVCVNELLCVSSRTSLWRNRLLRTQRAQRYKMLIFKLKVCMFVCTCSVFCSTRD